MEDLEDIVDSNNPIFSLDYIEAKMGEYYNGEILDDCNVWKLIIET